MGANSIRLTGWLRGRGRTGKTHSIIAPFPVNRASAQIAKPLSIGLAIAALALFVRDTAQQALDPLLQTNNELCTQVVQFLHPTPTILPDPVTIIHEIHALARLETIQYTVEKVITAESGQAIFRSLFGDRLLFVAHRTVIAGIDLNKLSQSDLSIQDGTLKIHLPDPEIFSASLDNENSYVFDLQTGFFTQGQPNLETLARQTAEQEIYLTSITIPTKLSHDTRFHRRQSIRWQLW